MAQDRKVVNMNRQREMDRFSMPVVLVRLRDASGQALGKLLTEFFDSADDALFGLADKAGTNQEQTAYFDAMRELRLRRKPMSLSIMQWVSRAFNEIGRFDPLPGSSGLQDVDQDSLTLMDHGELEQKVAIENLMTKLRNRHADAIGLLTARVATAVPGVRFEERQMPLSPEVICTGLGEACSDLEIDIRAKLVVLKLFDKLLISQLEFLYKEANRLLVQDGILPDLKRPPVHGTQNRTSGSTAGRAIAPSQRRSVDDQNDGVNVDDDNGATFTELSSLLRQESSGGQFRSSPGAERLDTKALMARLGAAQNRNFDTPDGGIAPLSLQLNHALQSEQGQVYAVQQVDSDVINLVTMLFDFILEDRQLPPLMKALIGRLQIPVLKVALCDRSFFNRGGHPARKLLNELAMAGIGWNEKTASQRDPLREKIESVVDRLLNDFTDNVDIFSELLQDFSHFMDLDRRRRELVEQRLRDAEEGRARHERAKSAVESLLNEALADRTVPAVVETLLWEPWRKYLQWILLRESEDSELWTRAVSLTRDIIWTVDPQQVDAQTRAKLLRAIPGVVDSIREGLQSISWDPFAIDGLIRDLELAHVDVLQQLVSFREEPVARQAVPPDAPSTESLVPEPVTPGPVVPEAPVEASPDPVDGSHQANEKPAQTAVAETAPAPEEIQSEAATEAVAAQFVEHADRMRVGSWIELLNDSQKVRCKLAAVIKATGKYIFVNRNGAKVAEYKRDELAAALSAGQVTMLDDGLIFDRALESIIDNLRHSRRD